MYIAQCGSRGTRYPEFVIAFGSDYGQGIGFNTHGSPGCGAIALLIPGMGSQMPTVAVWAFVGFEALGSVGGAGGDGLLSLVI